MAKGLIRKIIAGALVVGSLGIGFYELSKQPEFDAENPNGRKVCPIKVPSGMNSSDVEITTADVACDRVRLVGENGEDYWIIVPKKLSNSDYPEKFMSRNKKGEWGYFPPEYFNEQN